MNMIADLNALSGKQKDTFIDLRMVSDGDCRDDRFVSLQRS